MKCPKCKATMAPEVGAGRQSNGHALYARVSGMACRCGMWIELPTEPTSVAVVMQKERQLNRRVNAGGRPVGVTESRAKRLATEYADDIATWLAVGLSWYAIAREVRERSGVNFDHRCLKSYWLQQQGVDGV